MAKVKICGIRRAEDIEYVNSYKPDYIGFIFAESKRRVSVETAEMLTGHLNQSIKKVGVFVNEDIQNVLKIASICSLDVVQIHGNETPGYVDDLKNRILNLESINKMEIWKAIRVKDIGSIQEVKKYNADVFLLDTFVEGTYGGAGKVFDWDLAIEAQKYAKIFLAGGLSPQNVEEAIKTVNPYGIDTSSGVETDGYKDEAKVKEFIYKVRGYGIL